MNNDDIITLETRWILDCLLSNYTVTELGHIGINILHRSPINGQYIIP